MSNDIQKADQIAYRLFAKLTLVVNQARTTVDPPRSGQQSQPKVDKWFNLETPDTDLFRDNLRIYRSISSHAHPRSGTGLPPLELQVLLSVPELTSNQVLVYNAQDTSRVRVEQTPRYVLLESWVLAFTPNSPSASYAYGSEGSSTSEDADLGGEVPPSTIYKHGIPLFRSLFSLLRILPAWRLFKRLRRRAGGGNRNGNLGILVRVRSRDNDEYDGQEGILEFGTRPSLGHPPLPTASHAFPPVPHPSGTLSLSTQYLTEPNFQLDELESLLSSRFLSLDGRGEMSALEGLGGEMDVGFTPTLVKNQPRNSLVSSGSPGLGSLPIRTSLPKSPPRAASIADRFVLPSSSSSPASASRISTSGGSAPAMHTRTTSLPQQPSSLGTGVSRSPRGSPRTSPRSGNIALPSMVGRAGTTGSRLSVEWPRDRDDLNASGSASGSGGSGGSSRPVSGIAARIRKESTGRGTTSGADLPSSPGPLPIRRPNINPVHPFKASTLSSSPSLQSPSSSLSRGPQPSPLSSVGSGLPLRPFPSGGGTTSPTSSRMPVPPSPIGAGMNAGSLGRPSPPFAPSSLGDRRSLASAEGESDTSPKLPSGGRKRYSSSFRGRYDKASSATAGTGTMGGVGGAPGSAGSAGSADIALGLGSAGRREGGSFLSNNTDDDDISMFVQDIDARKPLRGITRDRDATETGRRLSTRDEGGEEEEESGREPIPGLLSTEEPSDSGAGMDSAPGTGEGSTSASRPMLTSEAEVEERLRQMNETFLESLEGLGSGGRRRERRGSSPGSGVVGRMSIEGSRDSGTRAGRGRGYGLPSPLPRRPDLMSTRSTSRSTSAHSSDVGAAVQGSDEVIGRMSFDEDRRRSRP